MQRQAGWGRAVAQPLGEAPAGWLVSEPGTAMDDLRERREKKKKKKETKSAPLASVPDKLCLFKPWRHLALKLRVIVSANKMSVLLILCDNSPTLHPPPSSCPPCPPSSARHRLVDNSGFFSAPGEPVFLSIRWARGGYLSAVALCVGWTLGRMDKPGPNMAQSISLLAGI